MNKLITLALLALALSGCGQKGPLYLPPPEPEESEPAEEGQPPAQPSPPPQPAQPAPGAY